MHSKATWIDGMAFEATLDGHKIIMDADQKFGGKDRGPRPKGLTLVSLLGCTGMDVVSLMNKMRVPFKKFDIEVETETTDQHPKVFKDIYITYIIEGDGLEDYIDKIEKSVKYSQDRYCGVSAMLKKNSNIYYKIIVNGKTFRDFSEK